MWFFQFSNFQYLRFAEKRLSPPRVYVLPSKTTCNNKAPKVNHKSARRDSPQVQPYRCSRVEGCIEVFFLTFFFRLVTRFVEKSLGDGVESAAAAATKLLLLLCVCVRGSIPGSGIRTTWRGCGVGDVTTRWFLLPPPQSKLCNSGNKFAKWDSMCRANFFCTCDARFS